MTKPQASRGEVWRGVPPSTVSNKMKNEAHIGDILGVCKVNMRGGGEEGSNLKFLTKIDPHTFFLKKFMSNS